MAARYGISTAEQHDLKLHRYTQYQQALADDRAFQKLYMADVPLSDSKFRKQTGVLSADEGIFPHHRRRPGQVKAGDGGRHGHLWRANPPGGRQCRRHRHHAGAGARRVY